MLLLSQRYVYWIGDWVTLNECADCVVQVIIIQLCNSIFYN